MGDRVKRPPESATGVLRPRTPITDFRIPDVTIECPTQTQLKDSLGGGLQDPIDPPSPTPRIRGAQRRPRIVIWRHRPPDDRSRPFSDRQLLRDAAQNRPPGAIRMTDSRRGWSLGYLPQLIRIHSHSSHLAGPTLHQTQNRNGASEISVFAVIALYSHRLGPSLLYV